MPVVVPLSSSSLTTRYRTLGELRSDMRAMLGAASAGSAAGLNASIIDLHLRNAQTVLYWAHDWAHLRRYEDKTIGVNAYLTDYPATANPERIKAISILRGSVWSPPIPRGISPQLYATQANPSWPQRWEPYEQIETWPKADQIYTARIFFIRQPVEFTSDGDRASVDDTLISVVAIGSLKAHYRQPDAKIHSDAAEALLRKLKAKSWGQDVFRPNDYADEEPLVKPEVV